jgi:hypothetical protein
MPRLRKSRSYTSSHPNAPLWSITGPLYLYLYTEYIFSFVTAMKIFKKSGKCTSLFLLDIHVNKIIVIHKLQQKFTCNLPATSPCWLMMGV